MKKIVFNLILLFTVNVAFAQDTITKRNAEKIVAKILEIGTTEIKFKKFDNQEGPLYIVNKSEIKMIVYANGMKELFEDKEAIKVQPATDDYVVKKPESNKIDMWSAGKYRQGNRMLNEREAQYILLESKDKKIMGLVGQAKDAKKMQYIGFAAIPLGIGAGALLIGSAINGGYNGFDPSYLAGSAVCALAAIACPIVAITLKSKRTNCNRAAVKLYNEKF